MSFSVSNRQLQPHWHDHKTFVMSETLLNAKQFNALQKNPDTGFSNRTPTRGAGIARLISNIWTLICLNRHLGTAIPVCLRAEICHAGFYLTTGCMGCSQCGRGPITCWIKLRNGCGDWLPKSGNTIIFLRGKVGGGGGGGGYLAFTDWHACMPVI